MKYLRLFLPDFLAILFFIAIGLAYFIKPVTEGLILTGHDHSGGTGAAVEMEDYRARHNGERTRWTNVLFSGMPTYQIAPSYPSTETLYEVESFYKLKLPQYVVLVFVMLLGFYIMLRAFNFRTWMAALGAVMWAFSSYYFIIIGAGHIWKFYTLAYIPATIAGMVLCYRGKYAWGLVVTAFFMALQVMSNHVQMSYYFLPVIALMALAFCPLWNIKKNTSGEALLSTSEAGSGAKAWASWVKATCVFALGCLMGVAVNVSNLYHTWEYQKESMRGKSELTQKTMNAEDQTSSGLERSYITAWSYGIGETWTLLVPNTKGGASIPLTQNKTAMEKANPMYQPVYQSLGQYWGEQPGTSGPVYVGAFVMFLFILGLFIVRGPMKWALLILTVLSIMLSWGKNFMGLTDFFLDYVPMYDKFRTVASILVVAEFTIPLLAMLALRELLSPAPGNDNPSSNDKKVLPSTGSFREVRKAMLAAFVLTAGPCLLFWLMPDVFFGNYVSSSEMQMLQGAVGQGYIPQDMLGGILSSISDMRRAMFTADALRSFMVIAVGCLILVVYKYGKIKNWAAVACILVLCLADMWDVNKRYLNDAMFSAPQPTQNYFTKTEADEAILQDPDPYYRVLNLSVSTFNDNTTSYWHKSIGGYHAAKLRRYQELIEAHIQPEMASLHQAAFHTAGQLGQINGDSLMPVLNMLNMKYAILPLQGGKTAPVFNPWANGNAWFVSQVVEVQNADDELLTLDRINTKHAAVINTVQFALPQSKLSVPDSTDYVRLTSYEANALSFESNSRQGGLAVFSDIYYPGWTCMIDGEPADILRANYVLRAVFLPAGRHTVTFTFDPQTLHTTETIAYTALISLVILLLFLLVKTVVSIRRKRL